MAELNRQSPSGNHRRGFTARQVIAQANVECLCTSDRITDGLEAHSRLAKSGFATRVLPSLRADDITSTEKLERVASAIRTAGGTALPLRVDVTDAVDVGAACQAIMTELGPCAFLVNGAGGNQSDAVTTVTEFTPEEIGQAKSDGLRGFFGLSPDRFLDVIRVNTMGTVIPCQIFGREMARQGRGAIVNFASMNSDRPLSRVPAYGMAKAGVVNFTQWLATYLAPAGVRVNAVAPGFFVNERSRKILMDAQGGLTARGQNVMAHTPLKRFGEAQDLLGAVRWLLNDEQAGFATGITVAVDGGFMASSGV